MTVRNDILYIYTNYSKEQTETSTGKSIGTSQLYLRGMLGNRKLL